jgi:hypothetical protein
MKPTTFAITSSDATKILNNIGTLTNVQKSGTAAFYAKTSTLADGTTATKLFERSAISEKFLSLVAPQKLKRENEHAFDAIALAVGTRFPEIDGKVVMESLGIRKGESVKLSKFSKFNETFDSFKNAVNAKNIHAASNTSKNRFDKYRLQSTPGLVAFTKLTSVDLSKLKLFSTPDKVQELLSFQKFVSTSLDTAASKTTAPNTTAPKTGTIANDERGILNFISSWCQMNKNEVAP